MKFGLGCSGMATRIALMLPGAVSLGAYEGGALAALITAVQESEGELVVDAIASASAGSITSIVTARALLCGDDPVDVMKTTWVTLPDLKSLGRGAGPNAPLSMNGLISTAEGILEAPINVDRQNTKGQKERVNLSMALTALGGLTYSLVPGGPTTAGSSNEPLEATTYVDFRDTSFGPHSQGKDYKNFLPTALASGSTPVGFLPRPLDRKDDIAAYRRNGIKTPPLGHDFTLWYSDGGDVNNQPLGRLLDLIERIDAEPDAQQDNRIIVVLNIEPEGAPTFTGTWFDQPPPPNWISTLLRVNHIRSNQSLYDDLRTLEKTNQHIAWITKVGGALGVELGSRDLSGGLQKTADEIAGDRSTIRGLAHRTQDVPAAASTPAQSGGNQAQTIVDLLRQAAGLYEKRQIDVQVISPRIDPGVTASPDSQLAGEFLFHFGGFFDVKFRESDFALGFRNANYWLRDWLPQTSVGNPRDVLDTVDAAYDALGWDGVREGNASVGTLSLRQKLRAVRLLFHIERVIARDIWRELRQARH